MLSTAGPDLAGVRRALVRVVLGELLADLEAAVAAEGVGEEDVAGAVVVVVEADAVEAGADHIIIFHESPPTDPCTM